MALPRRSFLGAVGAMGVVGVTSAPTSDRPVASLSKMEFELMDASISDIHRAMRSGDRIRPARGTGWHRVPRPAVE
jgi:hypothetical protein